MYVRELIYSHLDDRKTQMNGIPYTLICTCRQIIWVTYPRIGPLNVSGAYFGSRDASDSLTLNATIQDLTSLASIRLCYNFTPAHVMYAYNVHVGIMNDAVY